MQISPHARTSLCDAASPRRDTRRGTCIKQDPNMQTCSLKTCLSPEAKAGALTRTAWRAPSPAMSRPIACSVISRSSTE